MHIMNKGYLAGFEVKMTFIESNISKATRISKDTRQENNINKNMLSAK